MFGSFPFFSFPLFSGNLTDGVRSVGGIWAHVNKTSGLQLNSLLYRFHPGVLWSCTFPKRDEILHGLCPPFFLSPDTGRTESCS